MSPVSELRAFRAIAIVIVAVIPTVVGLVAGFGGLEAMAALFGREAPGSVDPSLRNHLRAICIVFPGFGWLYVWSTLAIKERKGAFRIVVGVIILAGFARIAGWISDGPPGALATTFLAMELVLFPALFLWHQRLLRVNAESSGK
jgi:uncharacterized protein DUF4345